jgi:hypothetical protein
MAMKMTSLRPNLDFISQFSQLKGPAAVVAQTKILTICATSVTLSATDVPHPFSVRRAPADL